MTYYSKIGWGQAKKSIYNGQMFDSKFEAKQAWELDMLKKNGEIINWEAHKRLPLVVNGYKVCDYEIDFIIYREGETEYLETKGYATDVWKLKWKLFEALYTKEGNKLTVIFQGKQKPPKLRKFKVKI